MRRHDARDGRLADVIEPRHVGAGFAAGDDAFCDLPPLAASSFGRRPPMRPSARASASPADVRSRIMARSNSAKLPTICIIMRPAGMVVSMFSVSLRKPAPALDPLHDMQHVLQGRRAGRVSRPRRVAVRNGRANGAAPAGPSARPRRLPRTCSALGRRSAPDLRAFGWSSPSIPGRSRSAGRPAACWLSNGRLRTGLAATS